MSGYKSSHFAICLKPLPETAAVFDDFNNNIFAGAGFLDFFVKTNFLICYFLP